MPTATVPNDLFMEHRGVEVFHTFKNDDEGQGRRLYWYTTDMDGSENDESAFDVRALPAPNGCSAENHDDHEKIIASAIDAGLVKQHEALNP